MRGWLPGVAVLLMAFACAPSIAPAPRPCTQVKHVIGRPLAPNLMLLIDRSAAHSQNLPQMLNAISFFLASQPTLGRYGVTVFPHDDMCGPATASEVLLDLPDAGSLDHDVELEAQANMAVFTLGSITASGGASLAESLRFVSSMPQMRDGRRGHTIILFTSGVPGCSDGGLGDTIQALTDLANEDTRTVVVGFGDDLGDAGATLDSLARYGKAALECPHGLDSECGFVADPDGGVDVGTGARCNVATRVCEPAFIAATNGMELNAALSSSLSQLSGIGGGFSCLFALEHEPANASMVSVYLDGQEVPRCDGGPNCDTWEYDPNVGVAAVRLLGSTCQRLFDATANDPLTVAIRIDGCDGSASK